ncbi:uncharacterized protein LOC127255138 [Andrographis paniculata]|uniref:uncharacterized protein LOC127255138 n=1 Tax=Andrographis paniculata TaxID=175694 RepID=UPI0021E93AC5|nr:uncharacterized protein LOC127255138 [Andrographis paniculata]XP_051136499.1 uncharacterized protein LOC127255138 [Andrographis paniculata]XP_051136505.1 uncharacterized protein LOC127255138 [Andrographis paniculata]XP_051136508.1 uncharacterized protein LOC127255138 [Andrographis paniculata]
MEVRDLRECHSCKSLHSIILHNVPHRGSFVFLCTACVLRHHTGSFCPLCFDFYDDTSDLSNESRVMCLRCPAIVHLTCLPSARSSSTFRFICPQCSDPSFKFFDFRPDSPSSKDTAGNSFARDLPRQLLCAAKISSACTRRMASVARTNSERRVREAVVARKRAKEAVERVTYLMVNRHREDA